MNDISGNDHNQAEYDRDIAQIREALKGLRFGAVSIIVQDGVVVQIDRTEKRRLRRPSESSSRRIRHSDG